MEMLLAIQPVNADRTGLHAVVRGENASAARADLARRMQQLRAEIEAEREKK